MPIQEVDRELSKKGLEAEVFFGSQARALIWNLHSLVGRFGIDLNAYLKWFSGEQWHADPLRQQLHKAVYNMARSGETYELEGKVKAAIEGIEGNFRPRL